MAFFLRRLRNHAEAEDLTQEVFVRLASVDQDQLQSVEAYVFRVAANLLGDRSRREKVRADYRSSLWHGGGEGVDPLDPARTVEGREALMALTAGLRELPARTRSIFVLYRFENVDKRAIAEAYGVSVSAVDKHLMRAMAHLIRAVRDAE